MGVAQAAAPGAGVVVDRRAWLHRIASEVATLSKSLPVNLASSIFVRVDEARMDVIKALVIGPEETPYANGCFEFDFLLPPNYPQAPPKCLLKTTGRGSVR
ncbi:ubiquitin-conjugating enzyme/RWD-like protein [Ochromonadaceae sp. CCMP2298]|nr:ubiquitin-conjugating enzyme/RWD-like protein [Ochromonadaceae sp. CCMP2298]